MNDDYETKRLMLEWFKLLKLKDWSQDSNTSFQSLKHTSNYYIIFIYNKVFIKSIVLALTTQYHKFSHPNYW